MKGGRGNATIWQLVTFGWCEDLLTAANKGQLDVDASDYLAPKHDKAEELARTFDAAYASLKVCFQCVLF